ncbi:MAG TPA: HAD-IIB family hydrolase [Anaerolineaceae bacterium]|nr:HAD-IIB family hydrolase [Anaerolineaceae bacterium]
MNRDFIKENIKLAAFDLDGTILTKSFITDVTKSTITRLAESGIGTIVATGRHVFTLPPAVFDIPSFQIAIGSNGTMIGNIRTKEVYNFDGFDVETALCFLRWLPTITNSFHVSFHDGSGYLMKEDFERLLDLQPNEAEREKSAREYRRVYTILDDIEHVEQTMKPVAKFGFRMAREEDVLAAVRMVRENFGFEAAITDYQTIEVTKAGVTKASGLKRVCDHYGLKTENVIVFGDSGNDIPAMEIAGYAVAVSNAHANTKVAADEVTESIYEDGVALAINRLFDL